MSLPNQRKLLFGLCILLLLLNSLMCIYQPIYEIIPNPFLGSIPYQHEVIINQPDEIQIKFFEPIRVFLFCKPNIQNSNLKLDLKSRYFIDNLNISLIVISIFYIFYRLSRTSIDDFHFNMEQGSNTKPYWRLNQNDVTHFTRRFVNIGYWIRWVPCLL